MVQLKQKDLLTASRKPFKENANSAAFRRWSQSSCHDVWKLRKVSLLVKTQKFITVVSRLDL